MVEQKKQQIVKKRGGNGIFFIGIVGLVILTAIFYSPSSKTKDATTSKATSTPGFFSTLFKSFSSLAPSTSTNKFRINTPPPQSSQVPGQTFGQYGQTQILPENQSVWKGKVTLSQGNAVFETQPYKEYVMIRAGNVGPDGVTITGWRLENGRGDRTYDLGGNIVRYTPESAVIPSGAKLFIPQGTNYYQPVTLFQNQSATIVTDGVLNMGPAPLQGFQVNKCSGYLEQSDEYQFFPPLYSQCPMPTKEVGASTLENSCYRFLQSLNSCHTPKFPDFVKIGNRLEPGYVDNTPGLSGQCKDYLKAHFSYTSCVVNHSKDKDFYGNEWRLFLNRTWELWGKDRETFTLYDGEGKVVDQSFSGF